MVLCLPARLMNTVENSECTRTVPPAPLRLHVNSSDILPTAYSLEYTAEHAAGLSSSYSSTPRALSKTLKFFPKQIISHDLIKDMKKSDFIGFIPNPGFKNNSMLTAGSNTVDGSVLMQYVISGKQKLVMRRRLTLRLLRRLPGKMVNRWYRYHGWGLCHTSAVPKKQSYRGKQRMNRFDYMALNSTYLMALRTLFPILTQILFMAAIPPVWQHAQKCQSSLYHHNNPHTLWAELGFLFHMMQAIERQSRDEVGGVVEEDSHKGSSHHQIFSVLSNVYRKLWP